MGKYGASTNSTTKELALSPRSPVMFSLKPGRPPTSGCKECIGYPDEPPESEIFGRMKRREGIELIMSQFGRKCKQWIADRSAATRRHDHILSTPPHRNRTLLSIPATLADRNPLTVLFFLSGLTRLASLSRFLEHFPWRLIYGMIILDYFNSH